LSGKRWNWNFHYLIVRATRFLLNDMSWITIVQLKVRQARKICFFNAENDKRPVAKQKRHTADNYLCCAFLFCLHLLPHLQNLFGLKKYINYARKKQEKNAQICNISVMGYS